MCCFQQRHCLGNILAQSLEKIWFSDLAEDVRRQTIEGILHPTCQIDSCPFFHKVQKTPYSIIRKMYPSQFEIDLPMQWCNIGGEKPTPDNPACIMCERHTRFERQQDRLDEICYKLSPYIRHVDQVHIQGIAEPFWKERIFDLIDKLDVPKYQEKIRITTTTNGTLMNKERRARFLSFPKSTITWSLDAATGETFQKIRRFKTFDRIVESLKAYCSERNPERQYVHIHNNINLINIHEVTGMVELAAEAGVTCLEFNPTYGIEGICVNKDNAHLFCEAQERIMERAYRLGVNVVFMRDLALDLKIPNFVPPKPPPTITFVDLELPKG